MNRVSQRGPVVSVLVAAIGLFVSVLSNVEVSTQTIYDMSEINGDLKILGKYTNSYTSKMAFLDFNDDGSGDLFLNDRYDNGAVYGFLEIDLAGVPNRFMDLLDEPYDFEIRGPNYPSVLLQFGLSLASGDWNHDGIADLAIGDPSAYLQGEIEHGQVYVLFGSSSWQSGMVVDLDQTPADITIHHNHPVALVQLGICLASGDVNGDGIDDLAKGAPYAPNPEDFGPGAVFVLYGSESFITPMLVDLSQEPLDLAVYGERAGDKFGRGLALGDVNGDGNDDLVVGAWDADYTSQKRGWAYVIYGSDQFPSDHTILLNHQAADLTIKGPEPHSSFGMYIDVGHFNGDQYADFCITAYSDETLLDYAGSAHLFYGRPDFSVRVGH